MIEKTLNGSRAAPARTPLPAAPSTAYEPAMLDMRPDCERCGSDLPADEAGAFICSFECTFCAECAETLDDKCPNCGGELMDRPARVDDALARHPASHVRRFKG